MRWDSKVTVGSFKQVSCQGIYLLTIVAQSHPGDEWLPWWRFFCRLGFRKVWRKELFVSEFQV